MSSKRHASVCARAGPSSRNYDSFLVRTTNCCRSIHDKESRWDGLSFIFTTSQLTIEDTIKAYFDKDVVEKSFQALKGVVRLRPVRHWLSTHVEAHVFICYLSGLLLALLKMKVAPLGISFQEALNELDGLYRVYLRDPKSGFTLGRLTTLTKRQEQILRAVDKRLLKKCKM